MTNAVPYNLVTDINYIITAISTPDHNIGDIISYISQLPKGKKHYKCNLNCSILFLRIGVVFFASFSTGWAFRLSQGRHCMLADRQITMFIYS